MDLYSQDPLLAIAIWFVVSGQGQTYTNSSILAALSLTIGLVTKEVVSGLISFAKGRIPSTSSSKPSTSSKTPSIKTPSPSEEGKPPTTSLWYVPS